MAVAHGTTVKGTPTALSVRPRGDFVETPRIDRLTKRALAYLEAGYPIHFRGPAGTGKTTLALHVASQLSQPVMLITGDEEFATSDLVGGRYGYRYRKTVDRFIHSVLKYEEDAVQQWVDNRLTTACRQGFTLVYDEFTRSRPEANNVLLGVLEEGLLILPDMNRQDAYIKVHPDFRAIFTSNPQEYAGVYEAQDALSDRLVTLDLDYYDRETEIAITTARSELPEEQAAKVVNLVRDFRASGEYDQAPTLRACIMIAKVAGQQSLLPSADDSRFVSICLDVLESKTAFTSRASERRNEQRKMLLRLIEHHCRTDGAGPDVPEQAAYEDDITGRSAVGTAKEAQRSEGEDESEGDHQDET
jgi:gas vesicle protein GvpN